MNPLSKPCSKPPRYVPKHVVIVLICLLVIHGKIVAQQVTYGFPKCEFSVRFPNQPLRQRVQVEGGIEIEQAVTTTNESFVRAECLPLAIATPVDERQALALMRTYAQDQGLQNIEVKFQRTSIGPTSRIKGTKTVMSRKITADGQCIFGNSSVVCMLVGSPAEISPTTETIAFLSSVRRIPLTSEQRWVPLGPGARGASMFMDAWSQTKKDGVAQFILLHEFTNSQNLPIGGSMRSSSSQMEFSCDVRKFKRRSMNAYSDSMGFGEVVATQPESDWIQVGDLKSESGILFSKVCP